MKMNKPRFAELCNMLAGRRATTERERWDVLWAHPRASEFVAHCYGEGLHDNHIDTALRRHFSRPAPVGEPAPNFCLNLRD
jgi:hypothetical protein